MSKNTFKTKASSSRAAAASGGFGGFRSPSSASTLSYLTEPPNLDAISDANVKVSFKNLSKKDGTTKAKALEDLRSHVHGYELTGDGETAIEDAILDAWIQYYPRISIDNSRRVRELSQSLLADLIRSNIKRMQKRIQIIIGSWVAGMYDRDRSVVKITREALKLYFSTQEKETKMWNVLHSRILDYAISALAETPESLSDERTMSADESLSKYHNVIGSSLSLVSCLLEQVNRSEILKEYSKYTELLSDNKKLWEFCTAGDPMVRKATFRLLQNCVLKYPQFIENDLKAIAGAFIVRGTQSPQYTTSKEYVMTLVELTQMYPQVWMSSSKINGFSRICRFLEKGSQLGPHDYWVHVAQLIRILPAEVIPSDVDHNIDVLNAFRKGINHREGGNGAREGWIQYFELVDFLLSKLTPDQNSDISLEEQALKLVQHAIYPAFDHYFFGTDPRSQWSVYTHEGLVRAYEICLSIKHEDVVDLMTKEWSRLANELVLRIGQSLPEQSDKYKQSQDSVATIGTRWFELCYHISLKCVTENLSKEPILSACKKIVQASYQNLINRNGKPYSAASIIESSLRYQLHPVLWWAEVESLLKDHFLVLIQSPSQKYIVSILDLYVRNEVKEDFPELWNSKVDEILTKEGKSLNSFDFIGIITALLSQSHKDTLELARKHDILQAFLLQACMSAINGNVKTWPLFMIVLKRSACTHSALVELLEKLISNVDVSKEDLSFTFNALDLFVSEQKNLMRDPRYKVEVLSVLLAIIEASTCETNLEQAAALRDRLVFPDAGDKDDVPAIVHVAHDNLYEVGDMALSIYTLTKQIDTLIKGSEDPQHLKALLPDIKTWEDALSPFLHRVPNPALATMRPFTGALFLVRKPMLRKFSSTPRDNKGYSIPLRIALYTARLFVDGPFYGYDYFKGLISPEKTVEMLFLLGLTVEMVTDQIDLMDGEGLLESCENLEVMDEVQIFISEYREIIQHFARSGIQWEGFFLPQSETDDKYAELTRSLLGKFLAAATHETRKGYYAAKALTRLLQSIVSGEEWSADGLEEWLTKTNLFKPYTGNVLGVTAILVGLEDALLQSKVVSNFCNQLVSNVLGASLDSNKTFPLLVLLNAALGVYEGSEIPVAQNRIVSAVNHILGWVPDLLNGKSKLYFTSAQVDLQTPAETTQYSAQICCVLQQLLPRISKLYGSHWTTALDFCISHFEGEKCRQSVHSAFQPAIGMSLKLFSILSNMKDDSNDDLVDALEEVKPRSTKALLELLHYERDDENVPLNFIDSMLMRLIHELPTSAFTDLSTIYYLLGSKFKFLQMAAYDILHRALPEAQQQISVDLALSGKTAHLTDELLSLLAFDTNLDTLDPDEFPAPLRTYLFSWHIVFDSLASASIKVRNDYNSYLQLDDIGKLLDVMAILLGHSHSESLNLNKAGITPSKIRQYDLWEANDQETNARNMEWLLVNLYYQCLKYSPSAVKSWWLACKKRQTTISVESWTAKYFSHLILEDSMEEVRRWSNDQELVDDEKPLQVRVSSNTREIQVSYEVDDMQMALSIKFPQAYPLEGVKVESVNRVAVNEEKWNSWLRTTQGVITFSNGSVIDGLVILRKNITGAMKGHTECSICYSIISSDKKTPDKKCSTCNNLFHGSCLAKWFQSSNENKCPLCRQPFSFGMDTPRRQRGGRGD